MSVLVGVGGRASAEQFVGSYLLPTTPMSSSGASHFKSEKFFRSNLVEQVGEFLKAVPMARGDLRVHPTDFSQQQLLLNLISVAGRAVSASLPKSAAVMGVISFVDIAYSEEELLAELADQGVSKTIRYYHKINEVKTAIETVKLFFDLPKRPDKVFMVGTAYSYYSLL
jgi:hypothetical protein